MIESACLQSQTITNSGCVIVQIMGGLGNQMFQYALGRAISERTGAPLLLDTLAIEHAHHETPRTFDLDIFELQPRFATRADVSCYHSHGAGLAGKVAFRLRKGSRDSEIVYQAGFGYQPETLMLRPPLYLVGLWQSYRYFADIEDLLRRDYRFRDALPPSAADFAKAIGRPGSVCLHVRRGDYTKPMHADVIGLSGIDYYHRAVARVCEYVEKPEFFIFSDDLAWCQTNFGWLKGTVHFVEYEPGSGTKIQASDLQLMSGAEYFITANSTFSWWAAWLAGNRAKLVVTPRNWFKDALLSADDLIPKHWERL